MSEDKKAGNALTGIGGLIGGFLGGWGFSRSRDDNTST